MTKNTENALKAQRLNDLHTWMHERYLLAYKLRDEMKMRSHAGTLYFIETGIRPYEDDPLCLGRDGDQQPAFHAYAQHLYESAKESAPENPLHTVHLGEAHEWDGE